MLDKSNERMSTTKETRNGTAKTKQKISKAQMQLLLIKKKQCDTLALCLVERLLEPKIEPDWLLSNLKHLNQSHLEDVIEERAITKLCGYVLCSEPLSTISKQRFSISTKHNKVFDISKRKNFCSSRCYGASNYLLEQMLTSPLWLRDKEPIPKFVLLPKEFEHRVASLGEEMFVDENGETKARSTVTNTKSEEGQNEDQTPTVTIEKPQGFKEEENVRLIDEDDDEIEQTLYNVELPVKLKSTPVQTKIESTHDLLRDGISNANEKLNLPKSGTNVKSILKSAKSETCVNKGDDLQNGKQKKLRERAGDDDLADTFARLVTRVENIFKEWVTEDTIKLLTGDDMEKQNIIDRVMRNESYIALCERLNRLEILSKNENQAGEVQLKPQPHFSVLLEESKKMELKVKAFFKGNTTIDPSESAEKTEDENEVTVVPITENQAPHAIRRQILLDKLNKVLPDLLRALSVNGIFEYKILALKVLIHTFAISSGNIIFKSVESALIGLIIVKMLSFIHPEVKYLLQTEKAMKYMTMILMSYKLDQYYLDRIVMTLLIKDA